MGSKNFYELWDEYFVVDQASKGFSIDAGASFGKEFGVRPSFSGSSVINVVRNDEMVAACLTTKVDAATAPGYFVEVVSNARNKAAAERLFREAGWDVVIRQLFFNLFAFGNAFLEIVRDSNGRAVELHVLETSEMEIVDEEGHGEPSYYLQRPANSASVVRFEPDEIVHFRLDRLTTGLWGEIPIRPLDQYVAIKIYVKSLLLNRFKDNLYRHMFLFPEGVSEDTVKKAISYLKTALSDPKKPLVGFGGIDSKLFLSTADYSDFLDLINKIDMAIITQLQVPPIMVGIPDNSGRASGEQETYKAFNTHIRGFHRLFEAYVNKELFPKLGFTGIVFRFGELDRKSEKDVVELLVSLKALGAKPDKLAAFARSHGLVLEDDFFNEDFFVAPSKNDKNQLTNKTSPSRFKLDEGDLSDRVGTGSEGSTRDDQLVTQAFERLTNKELRLRAERLYNESFN